MHLLKQTKLTIDFYREVFDYETYRLRFEVGGCNIPRAKYFYITMFNYTLEFGF